MSVSAPTTDFDLQPFAGEHHEEIPFIRKYIFSTDHKVIARQFLFLSLFFLLVGGLLAAMIRWQLGFPGQPMPGGGVLPDTMAPGGIILPEFYNALVTMHATFMIFFAIMPLLVGVFGNLLIPLQVGAPDMAFPRLNMASFWMAVPAGLLMLASFAVEGGASGAGWTAYAPLSASGEWTGVYLGQQLWLASLFILGFSSIAGAVNYITTVINMRAARAHLVTAAARDVGALRHLVADPPRDADPGRRPDHAAVRPDDRNGLLPPGSGGRATPLAAPLLVLRAPPRSTS